MFSLQYLIALIWKLKLNGALKRILISFSTKFFHILVFYSYS